MEISGISTVVFALPLILSLIPPLIESVEVHLLLAYVKGRCVKVHREIVSLLRGNRRLGRILAGIK